METLRLEELDISLIDLAKNIKRLRNWNEEQREIRLEKADSKISEKTSEVKSLVLKLCYDRQFCQSAGINYNNFRAEDSRLIKIAIADYLLNQLEN